MPLFYINEFCLLENIGLSTRRGRQDRPQEPKKITCRTQQTNIS